MEANDPDLTIRLSTGEGGDDDAVRRLASLMRREPPRAPVMLAEMCGSPVAAMSVADGTAVADPKRVTPSIFTLLRLRRLESRLIATVFGA